MKKEKYTVGMLVKCDQHYGIVTRVSENPNQISGDMAMVLWLTDGCASDGNGVLDGWFDLEDDLEILENPLAKYRK